MISMLLQLPLLPALVAVLRRGKSSADSSGSSSNGTDRKGSGSNDPMHATLSAACT